MGRQSKLKFGYIERWPKDRPPKKLVFLLHGYGKNARLMEKVADSVAEAMPDAHIIMPHAPFLLDMPDNEDGHILKIPHDVKKDNRKNVPGYLRRQWFSVAFKDVNKMRREILCVARELNRFIDKKRDELGLEDRDIAIMGFSQGGGIALYTAYSRQGQVGCVVGHSTIFVGDKGLKSAPATLFIYGDNDNEFTKNLASTQSKYKDSAKQRSNFLSDLTVKTVSNLRHRTNEESRKQVADFIKRKLTL